MSGGSPAGLRHPIGDPIPFLDRYRVQAKAAARSSVLPQVLRCSVALVYLPEARRCDGPDRVVPPCVTLPSPRRSPAPSSGASLPSGSSTLNLSLSLSAIAARDPP
jgi:hypothetical protein